MLRLSLDGLGDRKEVLPRRLGGGDEARDWSLSLLVLALLHGVLVLLVGNLLNTVEQERILKLLMALDLVQIESECPALRVELLLSCCRVSLDLLDLLNLFLLLGFVEINQLDVVVSLQICCHCGFRLFLRHVFNEL